MTDYKKMIAEHSCKPNQGCGVMTICMCGVAEDMADEIERLREALRGVIRVADRKTVEFDAARAALGEIVCDCEDGFRPSYHMGTGERFMLECHKCKSARAALEEKE